MDAGNNYHLTTAKHAIEINRLSRFFGSTCAVNDLSLCVEPGEVVGFIGPNGAGKTTTMRILSTLDEPDVGDAFIDGFSVVNDPDRVRYRLGFMPDSYGAYPNVSCIEYLDFYARAYGLSGQDRTRAIRRVANFTHIEHMLDKPMDGLSKGMKQRLCLGRALVHDPAVLILDEPAAGLDPRARIELKEMINGLAAEGKSLLISSHILTELAEISTKVAIIEQGLLLAYGSVDEILERAGTVHANTNTPVMAIVELDLLNGVNGCQPWLESQPDISNVKPRGKGFEFSMADNPARHHELLAAMIGQGFQVHRFAARRRSLEEAFLHVTRGRVQ